MASALVSAAETKAEIAALDSSAKTLAARAPHLAARIQLEQACMRHLPQILKGEMTVADAVCPKGSLDLVAAVSNDPIHSVPYYSHMARIACTYSTALTKVSHLTCQRAWMVSDQSLKVPGFPSGAAKTRAQSCNYFTPW